MQKRAVDQKKQKRARTEEAEKYISVEKLSKTCLQQQQQQKSNNPIKCYKYNKMH